MPPGRDPRSDEYKHGVLAGLRVRLEGAAVEEPPYAAGTAQAGAYHAGIGEVSALANDSEAGMVWGNALTDAQRAEWGGRVGTGGAADAWAMFRRSLKHRD